MTCHGTFVVFLNGEPRAWVVSVECLPQFQVGFECGLALPFRCKVKRDHALGKPVQTGIQHMCRFFRGHRRRFTVSRSNITPPCLSEREVIGSIPESFLYACVILDGTKHPGRGT